MEFIDKLKNIGCETYRYTSEKTSKIAKETKLKMKINENKSDIKEIYEKIGKAVYQQHIREEETDIKQEVEQYCNQIDFLCDEIEEIQTQLLNLKDKKKCSVCAKEMNIEDKFCPQCGKEQPKVEFEEVEIVNENSEKSNNTGDEVIKETENIIETPKIIENKNEQEEYSIKENIKIEDEE